MKSISSSCPTVNVSEAVEARRDFFGRLAAREPEVVDRSSLVSEVGRAVRACQGYLDQFPNDGEFGRDVAGLLNVLENYHGLLYGQEY